jgi:hypothetical protein
VLYFAAAVFRNKVQLNRCGSRIAIGSVISKGVPLITLMHESLATTQDYLSDARREGEAKKGLADADFVPKPRLVSGMGGD